MCHTIQSQTDTCAVPCGSGASMKTPGKNAKYGIVSKPVNA